LLRNGLSVLIRLIPWAGNTQIKKDFAKSEVFKGALDLWHIWLGARHDRDIIFVHVVPPAMHLRGDKATAHWGAVARRYVDWSMGANLPNIFAF